MSPQGDPGPGAFPSWAPPKAVSLPCLTQACVYAVQPPPAFRIPPVPGREASSLAPGMAPAPRSESRAPRPPPRPPSARAWRSPAGPVGSLPRPASHGLAPPEGGCGLGTTSCLLGEAAGISRTNRETTGPRPTQGGELPLASSANASGKEHADREGWGAGWGLEAPGSGAGWGALLG